MHIWGSVFQQKSLYKSHLLLLLLTIPILIEYSMMNIMQDRLDGYNLLVEKRVYIQFAFQLPFNFKMV